MLFFLCSGVGGEERSRWKRNIDGLPPTHTLIRDRTHNLDMWVPWPELNPLQFDVWDNLNELSLPLPPSRIHFLLSILIPHMNEINMVLNFSDLLHLVWYSQDPFMLIRSHLRNKKLLYDSDDPKILKCFPVTSC